MACVTIAIASCGRSSLANTLASIAAQVVPESWTADLVVADDSLDGSAARITKAADLRLPVRVINVPKFGCVTGLKTQRKQVGPRGAISQQPWPAI